MLKVTDGYCLTFDLVLRRLRLNRPPSVRYVISAPLARSIFACDRKAARNIETSVGAITQPCFTPVLILKGSDRSPLRRTHPFML